MNSVNAPIVELNKASVSFGNLSVHKDISFSVQAGESLTILGPSGIGKTLILKMIVGLLKPSSGSVKVMGHVFSEMEERELRKARAEIGMLFQGAALFDSLSVFENIAYPLRERRLHSESEIKNIVEERLQIVDLPGIGEKSPPELSGGQKKRVGLARALASNPKIVLFDEPTTGLDPTATRLIDELIIKLNQEYKITAISVTHDIGSARRISNRWLLINDGVVAADGIPSDVSENHPDVKSFITGNWEREVRCV